MKKLKIILSLILIFIGLIFVGEFGIFYLDSFMNDIPNTTIIYQPGMDHEKMKEEVEGAARDYGVEFFVIKQDLVSINENKLTLYTNSPNVKNYLAADKKIDEKEYSSLFFGKVDLAYDDYKNISDSDLEVYNNYYLFGNEDDIKSFKISLINKYAGNHPNFPSKSRDFDYTVYGLWTIIFVLCLLFTGVYVKTRKSDVFIKTIYGENRLFLILKEAILDLVFIVGIGLGLLHLLKSYTNTDFYKGSFYLMIAIFALVNTLMYLPFYKFDIRGIYGEGSKVTIFLLYLLKLFSMTLVSLVIATNFLMIKESLDFISQEDFFKKYKDYSYTNIGYIPRENHEGELENDITDNTKIKEIFYLKNFEDFKPIVLASFGNIENIDIVLANTNGLEYLKSEVESIANNKFEDKLYYLIPESSKDKEEKIESLDLRLENYFNEETINGREVLNYKGKAKIINIDDFLPLSSKTSKNPIIILDNRERSFVEDDIEGNTFMTTYDRNIMYKLQDDKFDEFIDEYNLESEIHGTSNVYERYQDGKLKMKRLLKMEVVISLILILLEFIILTTLTKLEFRMNAYKLSLMKILGYSFIERYKKLILLSLFGSLAAMLIFILINLKYKLIPYTYGIIIIGLVFLLEQVLIHKEIRKIENKNINLVLKGEFR